MLSRLPIRTKIAAIAVFTSLIGLIAAVYASSTILDADTDYSALLDRPAKSAVYLARMNRAANATPPGAHPPPAHRPAVWMKPVAQGNAALTALKDNWEEF